MSRPVGHPYVPVNRKVDPEKLRAAYDELGNIWKVGERLGVKGQTVYKWIKKLGIAVKKAKYSDSAVARLKAEYNAAADAGKVDELARSMGTTADGLYVKASRMGMGNRSRPRAYWAVWAHLTEEQARNEFEKFKCQSLGLGKYCAANKIDDLGFSKCMKKYFPDEWEHVMEAKQIKQTMYRYGRQFEYRVRDDLKKRGYFCMRSPASRSPVDVMAIKAGTPPLLVQCKRSAALGVGEWNELFDLAVSSGAIPILASCPTGRGTHYQRLDGRKDGSRSRQPFSEFTP